MTFLPEWKIAQFKGDPLQCHEWYGQFKSQIDSQSHTDDLMLTYLKTLVTGKEKIAIEFAYSCLMYKYARTTFEREFGLPRAVSSAHLDNLSNFSPLNVHSSHTIFNYSAAISRLVGVFMSLSYAADLMNASLLNQWVV